MPEGARIEKIITPIAETTLKAAVAIGEVAWMGVLGLSAAVYAGALAVEAAKEHVIPHW